MKMTTKRSESLLHAQQARALIAGPYRDGSHEACPSLPRRKRTGVHGRPTQGPSHQTARHNAAARPRSLVPQQRCITPHAPAAAARVAPRVHWSRGASTLTVCIVPLGRQPLAQLPPPRHLSCAAGQAIDRNPAPTFHALMSAPCHAERRCLMLRARRMRSSMRLDARTGLSATTGW
jgi:hypothetical protein